MECILKDFLSVNALIEAEFYELSSNHWEAPVPYRPKTYANIGIVNESLVAILKCYESEPRAVLVGRDAPIYTDSCLELFVAPIDGRTEYVNVECNSKGAFLCEFGEGKYNRALVSSLTGFSPLVESFFGEDSNGSFWGVKIEISKDFVSDLYKVSNELITFNKIKLNFYKCGDECETPHYLAFSPVTTLPPGFHNPDCFATFKREI